MLIDCSAITFPSPCHDAAPERHRGDRPQACTVNAIKEESRKGRTVILTTHMLDEAEELCTSLAIVNDGTMIASGSIGQVKSLGLKLLYLTISFDKVSGRILKAIEKAKPVKIEVHDSTVEVTVREEAPAYRHAPVSDRGDRRRRGPSCSRRPASARFFSSRSGLQ